MCLVFGTALREMYSKEFFGMSLVRASGFGLAIALVMSVVFAIFLTQKRYTQEPSSREEASSGTCTPIGSVPFKIIKPGRFCLASNLQTEDTAITIAADFVTLDFQGHTLTGPRRSGTNVVGVDGKGISNVRITGGEVRGFDIGIILWSVGDKSKGYNQIDNMRVKSSQQSGIRMYGSFNRLLDSEVSLIGGELSDSVHAHAIIVAGPGAIIARNRVFESRGADIGRKAEGVGIAVSGDANGAIIAENTIEFTSVLSGREKWVGPSPSTYAIWVGGDWVSNVAVYKNRISNAVNGIVIDTHVGAVVSNNYIFDTAVPITTRTVRSETEKMASGFGGYSPSQDDKRKPLGFVEVENNTCVITKEIVNRLASLKGGFGNCERDHDISLDEVNKFIIENQL
jgi:hypothetical protein